MLARTLTTTVHHVGTALVIINRWRNRNRTAFITAEVTGPVLGHQKRKEWAAKSQGPSAGGFNKDIQAQEFLYHKITGTWTGVGHDILEDIANAAATNLWNG